MGCRIAKLSGEPEVEGSAIFYDSVTMTVFGPIFENEQTAEAFANWLKDDPRSYRANTLDRLYAVFAEQNIPTGCPRRRARRRRAEGGAEMKIVFWGENQRLEKGIKLKKTNPDNDSLHADFKLGNRRVTAHYYPNINEFCLSFYPRISRSLAGDPILKIIRRSRAKKGWETRRKAGKVFTPSAS